MIGDCKVFIVVVGMGVLWVMMLWNGCGKGEVVGRIVGDVVDLFDCFWVGRIQSWNSRIGIGVRGIRDDVVLEEDDMESIEIELWLVVGLCWWRR